jgi:hypothetical protein
MEYDQGAIERREDAIVRNLLASDTPVCVLVMGGEHLLASNLVGIGGGRVEYFRVELKAYPRVAGGIRLPGFSAYRSGGATR